MDPDDLLDFAFDHVDKTIAELISSRNYRQAVKNLDKKRKKGTSASVQQQAIKAALLCALNEHDASHTVVVETLAAHVPPYQADVCGLLYTVLCDLKDAGIDVNDKTLEAVWSKTISAETRPDEKLHIVKEWIFMAIRRAHWNHVVKASQQVSNLSAGDNAEILKQWALQICARYLYHLDKLQTSSTGSDLDRKLALQILQKAAKDAPEPSESPREAGKWIATDKQLKLLAEVYQREGQHAQTLTLLEESKFAQLVDGNNEFICMKASLWQKASPEGRRRALDWVTSVMTDASGEGGQWLRDDWHMWHTLAHACSNLEQGATNDVSNTHSTHESELRNLVLTHSPSTPMNRAPTLALLDTALSAMTKERLYTTGTPTSRRIDACVEFFQTHVDRDFAAVDIQPRLRSLSLPEVQQISQKVHCIISEMENNAMTEKSNNSVVAWVRAATNALTIDRIIYDASISHGSLSSGSAQHQILIDYIGLCLKLYKNVSQLDAKQKISLSNTAKTNLENVAWSLFLLSQSTGNSSSIHLKSLINLLQQDIGQTDNWRVRVINDLQRNGATSQAWSHYMKLEVRHMLVETAAPMLFCQISATLPFGVKGFDPHLEIKRHLKFYKEMLTMVPQHQELAFDHQNYDHCIRMHDFLREIKASPVRWMLGLERRRIARLRGLSYDGDDILHDPAHMPVLGEMTRDLWAHAPTMTHDYIHLLACIDDLDECIRRSAEDEGIYLARIRIRHPKIRRSSPTVRKFDILLVLAEGLTKRDVELISGGLELLKRSISDLKDSVTNPHTSFDSIPTHDTTHSFDLEFLQSCSRICKKVPSRVVDRKVRTQATALISEAKECAEVIHKSTAHRIDSLKALSKESSVVEKLLHSKQSTSMETSILEAIGRDRAQEYFTGLIASRIETENSLLKILVN